MLTLLTALLFASPGNPVPANPVPRYYVLLFGGQADRFRPQTAHTWATFVRTVPQPDGRVALDSFTISWLPCEMPVRPFKAFPDPGRNYGLHETLDIFSTGKQRLSLWGPYEIQECWFHQAAAHKQLLDSGFVKFKSFDGGLLGGRTLAGGPRFPEISHCVHAITRTNPELWRESNPITWYGELITRRVAAAMAKVGLLVDPDVAHDWLISALEIEKYQFTRRKIGCSIFEFLP